MNMTSKKYKNTHISLNMLWYNAKSDCCWESMWFIWSGEMLWSAKWWCDVYWMRAIYWYDVYVLKWNIIFLYVIHGVTYCTLLTKPIFYIVSLYSIVYIIYIIWEKDVFLKIGKPLGFQLYIPWDFIRIWRPLGLWVYITRISKAK